MKLKNIMENPNPCWKGYEMVGMKMKDGKEVPNCVPKNEVKENVSVKLDRRGNETENLIVKLDGKEYEVAFSGDGWKDAYGIGFPNEDSYRMLNKDKRAKEMWNKIKPMVDKYLKTKNEVVEASAPGEWVAFLSTNKGKKLLKTFNTARGAKTWLSKNANKLLNMSNVESVGTMVKKDWDEREAKWAIESVNEGKIDWKDFYKHATNANWDSESLKSFEKKYGNISQIPHIADALKRTKDFNSFMKFISKFESVNEGRWANIMKGVRGGTHMGPWTIVVFDSGKKVIHQRTVDVRDAIPAHYEDIKRKFPDRRLSIEDNSGMVVYKESVSKKSTIKEGDCGCGGVKPSNPYSLKEFAINESNYDFGKVEYTAKNMGPVEIQDLAFAYHQTPINKLVGKNPDTKIRVARDLGRLLGKNPMNPNEKGKESAWLLYPYKGKLINTEEYKEIYKGLGDKLKKISNSLGSGGSIGSSSAAKAAAKADMSR